jgi:hypothetical protein
VPLLAGGDGPPLAARVILNSMQKAQRQARVRHRPDERLLHRMG